MSRYFVTDPPVAIPEFEHGSVLDEQGQPRRPNVMFIKARMDVETRAKTKSELFTVAPDGKTPELRAGASELALLLHNIVKWEGPDLSQVPCTPENIRRLDPNEPHVQLVLDEIGRRNEPRPSPNPKSPAGNGSLSAGKASSIGSPAPANGTPTAEQLAITIPRSPLPSVSDGRPSRSDD